MNLMLKYCFRNHRKIIKIEKNFRDSRLEDGRVFKDGYKSIDFFKDYESSLKEKKVLLQSKNI